MIDDFNYVEPDERLEAQRMHLRQLKKEEGFDWAHLAEVAGVSKTSVSKWVTNSTDKLTPIRKKNAESINRAYPHCPVEWIRGEVHWRNEREIAAFALLHAYGERQDKRALFDLMAQLSGWQVVEPDHGKVGRAGLSGLSDFSQAELEEYLKDCDSRYIALVRDDNKIELSRRQFSNLMSKQLDIFEVELKYLHSESEDR